MLIAGSATLLALGSAFAAEKAGSKTSSNDPGFNALDRNHDGKLSRSEAARNPYLAKRFKEADRNGDGSLSRTEYLRTMTAKDMSTLKEKVSGDKKESSSSAGGTKSK
jgi:Ca2+-binding EF-hand superfamily protein